VALELLMLLLLLLLLLLNAHSRHASRSHMLQLDPEQRAGAPAGPSLARARGAVRENVRAAGQVEI
jgi:hypothetical protein